MFDWSDNSINWHKSTLTVPGKKFMYSLAVLAIIVSQNLTLPDKRQYPLT